MFLFLPHYYKSEIYSLYQVYNMKLIIKSLLAIFFLLAICNTIQAQSNKNDSIKITYDGSNYYIIKNNNEEFLGHDFGIIKKKLLEKIKDFPELYKFADENFWSDGMFAILVANCYNDYKFSATKPKVDTEYFKIFRLNTKKEMKEGPTAEMLSVKQHISYLTKSAIIDVEKTYFNGTSSSSHGELFKAFFTYGNSGYYKTGFMLKNLNRSIGDDRQAFKYIRRYRGICITRTLGTVASGCLCVASFPIIFAMEKTGLGLLSATLGVCGLNYLPFGKIKYKEKNIKRTIDTYNKNLDKNPQHNKIDILK